MKPAALETHAAKGTVKKEDPAGKRGARLPEVEGAPMGICHTGEGCYGGGRKERGQTSKNSMEKCTTRDSTVRKSSHPVMQINLMDGCVSGLFGQAFTARPILKPCLKMLPTSLVSTDNVLSILQIRDGQTDERGHC